MRRVNRKNREGRKSILTPKQRVEIRQMRIGKTIKAFTFIGKIVKFFIK